MSDEILQAKILHFLVQTARDYMLKIQVEILYVYLSFLKTIPKFKKKLYEQT